METYITLQQTNEYIQCHLEVLFDGTWICGTHVNYYKQSHLPILRYL